MMQSRFTPARLLACLILLSAAGSAGAAPPDLTASGVPDNSRSINLGPTGMRGWVYHVNSGDRRADTGESRQILVTAVDAGSPAHGVLAADDVILGADGTGASPAPFAADARKSLAQAIAEAEARDPAVLKLLRWQAGATGTVQINLRTMGAYSATAPYNCPKSSKILTEGAQWVFDHETSGVYSFGALSLLATGNPAYATRVRNEARALIPSSSTRAQMMADQRDATSMVTWQRGHTLVFLTEYYLATGDADVLPAVEAYAVNIARNTSLFGTVGHIFAERKSDGSRNGPMGGVYGPVNSSGMPCFLGLLLARECGLNHPDLEPAIVRASRFFASYAGKGAIPYGEHEPGPWHETNGKSGLAALCFALQDQRIGEGKFYAQMATAAPSERETGHTGAFFNYLWSPLGANAGGEQAAAEHFRRISWHLDLARRWDGSFAYDCLNGEGPDSGASYNNFRMSTAALLVYAMPLRQLHITGRGQDPARWLSPAELAEAAAADDYTTAGRPVADLISDTGNWSPKVRRAAAIELKARGVTTSQRSQLHGIATNTALPPRVRAGACDALGRIGHSSSAAVLADLLTDPQNYVRYAAAEALRYLPNTDRQAQLVKILNAAASNARPLMPFDEGDPLHFDHGRLAMLLFYGGNAYGPKGILYNNISGVDRKLLYPAIRAVAANPVGQARSTLASIYPLLTKADTLALAGAVVDSVREYAPSDRMFASGVRQQGFDLMWKYDVAEGVPAGMKYIAEATPGDRSAALGVLEKYAASYKTITPEPDVIGLAGNYLNASGGNDAQNLAVSAAAQAVLDAIANDTTPKALVPFKGITSATADHPQLTLPANSTVLRVTSFDHAQGESVFTWRKLLGPGAVSFSGNGTAAGAASSIVIQPLPGIYLFEVTMSDSRGLTEVSETVSVALYDSNGSLPGNLPPTANPQTLTLKRGDTSPVNLQASDPEGYDLTYAILTPPVHGTLTGTPPALHYTPPPTFAGDDSFTYRVTDSGGEVCQATVSIMVLQASPRLLAYEPFDYQPINDPVAGRLAGKNGGAGWGGAWADATSGSNGGEAFIYDVQGNPADLYSGTFGAGQPNWNSITNNLPIRGGCAGLSDWSSEAAGNDRLNSFRSLARSAGAMAASNGGVLWLSAVFHLPNQNFHAPVGIALTSNNGSFVERAKTLHNSANGIGVGHGTDLTGGGRLNPMFWAAGNQSTPHPSPNTNPTVSSSLDNVVILKFQFGETEDSIRAWFFTENQEMTEAVFNANAVAAVSAIDESTLTTLTFSTIRKENAVDEFRLGHTFREVVTGITASPPVAHPQELALDQDVQVPVFLTGETPAGGPPVFAVTRQPLHGSLSGQVPNLTYAPAPGFHGEDRLTFSVTDAAGFGDEAVVALTVRPPADDYQVWAARWPGKDLADPQADLDGDGLSNNDERIWGLDPGLATSRHPIATAPNPVSLNFSYTRRSPDLIGRDFSVWTSADLSTWSQDTGAIQNPSPPDFQGVETVNVTLSPPAPPRDRLFVQVRATPR